MGEEGISVLHLQYDNYTILFVEVENVIHNVKTTIRCFEMIAKMKINWCKTSVSSIGIKTEWKEDCWIIGLQMGSLPIRYWSLPFGGTRNKFQQAVGPLEIEFPVVGE